jgi:ubiquinone/menaquinone biosynthesis C-methylase UbiE
MNKFDEHWKTALQNEKNMHYFMDQLENPKKSTFFFNEYFHELLSSSKKIIDLGGGNGTATQFLAKNYPHVEFTCADFSDELLESGEEVVKEIGINNLKFKKVDWYNLDEMKGQFDGVISLQTLSWLSDFKKPLEQIFTKIQPNWVGISSMFYDGDISTKVEVMEHIVDRYSYYNTYSLPQISKFCKYFEYNLAASKDFDIDIDISVPENKDRMSTFTVKLEQNEVDKREHVTKRLQISGPVLMNWKNILIKRH